MKKAFVILWLMVMCSVSFGAEYPELGVCTGDNVRLREDAGTHGKVIGRADSGTQFVIIDEAYADGQKWYEIAHPFKAGNAFISARFVNYGWQAKISLMSGWHSESIRRRHVLSSVKAERMSSDISFILASHFAMMMMMQFLRYIRQKSLNAAMNLQVFRLETA